MSESVVERVARAIDCVACAQCSYRVPVLGPVRCVCGSLVWREPAPQEQARAAIAAMREPTPEMVAVLSLAMVGYESAPDDATDVASEAIDVWQAGIDAALKESANG